ncbi:MAG TPA: NAD-dependent epimerase/dehydratase family protein [bacterium]|nr:NAD-dependent epimerase/dehydratase family protein [bacterium]
MNFPVLLTGASGFVGGHLAQALLRRKEKIKLLVRSTSRLPFKPGASVELCEGDVTDRASVEKAMKGVRTVYHLAGLLRGADYAHYEKVNAQGTRNVCEAFARQKNKKRLVYVSSLSAAGPSPKGGALTEDDEPHPVSFYGRTKLAGERIVRSFGSKIPATILRPGAVYGPREKDVLEYFKMVKAGWVLIPGDVGLKVSFVYVDDLVQAILAAGRSPRARGETFFVSDGQSYTWVEYSAVIAKALGRSFRVVRVPMPLVQAAAYLADFKARLTGRASIVSTDKIKEAPGPGWVCSNAKIVRKLGFRPRYDIGRGVQKSVDFYLKAGWI